MASFLFFFFVTKRQNGVVKLSTRLSVTVCDCVLVGKPTTTTTTQKWPFKLLMMTRQWQNPCSKWIIGRHFGREDNQHPQCSFDTNVMEARLAQLSAPAAAALQNEWLARGRSVKEEKQDKKINPSSGSLRQSRVRICVTPTTRNGRKSKRKCHFFFQTLFYYLFISA